MHTHDMIHMQVVDAFLEAHPSAKVTKKWLTTAIKENAQYVSGVGWVLVPLNTQGAAAAGGQAPEGAPGGTPGDGGLCGEDCVDHIVLGHDLVGGGFSWLRV